MEWKMKQLLDLDYSHPWVTAPKHIVEIYEEAKKHKGKALDIGTFQGHSALALHLAGLEVWTMDIDEKHFENAPFANHILIASENLLADDESLQVIVHDAQHGQHMIPELVRYFGYVQPGGVLIVHDTNELNLSDLVSALGYPKNTTTADDRMRTLSMFWKP
jgi:2-polyprenyl-3-methyl-5-hydroxy-6-metoxy-1,4-benzoquinol methylase